MEQKGVLRRRERLRKVVDVEKLVLSRLHHSHSQGSSSGPPTPVPPCSSPPGTGGKPEQGSRRRS